MYFAPKLFFSRLPAGRQAFRFNLFRFTSEDFHCSR